jgi:hypothetical protein
LALNLGYEVHPGRRHWHAIHSLTGSMVILSFGTKASFRTHRNILSRLKQGARPIDNQPHA